jgi:AMP nucleosidase
MPILPPFIAPMRFTDPAAALAQVQSIYQASLAHLREAMRCFVAGEPLPGQADAHTLPRIRACYPFVRVQTGSVARMPTRG